MLFKPNRLIDYDEIDASALNDYYRAMEVSDISARANNNAKLRRARQVFQQNQQQQPPSPPTSDEERKSEESDMVTV